MLIDPANSARHFLHSLTALVTTSARTALSGAWLPSPDAVSVPRLGGFPGSKCGLQILAAELTQVGFMVQLDFEG